MAEVKRFRVLLKDKREVTIVADSYARGQLGHYDFTKDGQVVGTFQIAEVVAIVEEEPESSPIS
jgi:flagellar hook protein FlgE